MDGAIYYLIMAYAVGWALSKTFPKNAPPADPEDWQEDGNVQPAWPDGFEIKSQEDGCPICGWVYYEITGHLRHCPDCGKHLTSLGLCAQCGIRHEDELPFENN